MYVKLRNCTIVEASSGQQSLVDIGISDGVVDSIGEVSDSRADKTIEVGKRFVSPAWVDLHTHVYELGTSLGVDADAIGMRSGVGVFVDAGSAGAGNFAGFREHVIKRAGVKIFSFLNIGYGGIPFFGIKGGSQASELSKIEVADPDACMECARLNKKYVVGIKVRLSAKANGEFGSAPLKIAKKCAKALGLPVMLHIGNPPPPVDELVGLLERGDILTHSFRPFPNSILDTDGVGRVSKVLKAARRRGVLIDIGHGNGSFSYNTAEAALADGFLPDTISTDIHALSLESPVHDLPCTMTKLLNLGMSAEQVLLAVTHNPAAAIGRPDLGRIQKGKRADLVVSEVATTRTRLSDSTGEERTFSKVFRPLIRVRSSEVSRIPWRAPPP
ncbi:MAG: amidohydrolase/deacetylase family metallohydrolase [Thaumarchaeota archaeon]|nr:amidohydrolase/deacetylase family metallohydrolase [Nitrososphaerota archaeon]